MDLSQNYLLCDQLEKLPVLNKENWLFEIDVLTRTLPHRARILQIGSCDGTRIIRLHERRPDLILSGLEIDPELHKIAQQKITEAGITANLICGDITNPHGLPGYDYVLCLNNTLGYIPDEAAAMKHMKKLGKHVIISVFGEDFNTDRAQEYFAALEIKDYSWIRTYTEAQVRSWGGHMTITPLGYLANIRS